MATVDWLLYEARCEPAVESVKQAVKACPEGPDAGKCKLDLFDGRMLDLAPKRLPAVA